MLPTTHKLQLCIPVYLSLYVRKTTFACRRHIRGTMTTITIAMTMSMTDGEEGPYNSKVVALYSSAVPTQRLSIEIIRRFVHGCPRHMDDFVAARIKGLKNIIVNHAFTHKCSFINCTFYLIKVNKRSFIFRRLYNRKYTRDRKMNYKAMAKIYHTLGFIFLDINIK